MDHLQWRSGVNVVERNSIRLAEVWLDEYAQIYYQRIGNKKRNFGDLSERKELRFAFFIHSIPFEFDLSEKFLQFSSKFVIFC